VTQLLASDIMYGPIDEETINLAFVLTLNTDEPGHPRHISQQKQHRLQVIDNALYYSSISYEDPIRIAFQLCASEAPITKKKNAPTRKKQIQDLL